MKLLFGLFLVAHGLIHLSYIAPKPNDPSYPFDFTKGWFAKLIGKLATPIGTFLTIVTTSCFVLGGLGVLDVPSLDNIWQQLTLVGATTSTLLLGLFWHRWLVMGTVINVVLLYGLLVQNWDWMNNL